MLSNKGLRSVIWNPAKLKEYGAVYKNGKPYVNNRQVVMPDEIQSVLKSEYKNVPSNVGILRFMFYLNKRYYGISRKLAFEFLKDQQGYQRFQSIHEPSHTRSQVIRAGPGVKFQCDHKSYQTSAPPMGGYTGVLFVTDLYSRKLWCYPHRGDETAAKNKLALQQLFDELGDDHLPRVLQFDNGPCFQGVFREYVESKDIKIVNSDPRHPASQGAVERLINTISRGLMSTAWSKYRSEKHWPRCLDEVVDFYNNNRQRIINKSPNDVWDEGHPDENLTERMVSAAEKTRNSRIYDRLLRPGDKVLLSLRISAHTDSRTKAAIDNGIRKKYLSQYDINHVYTIESRHGHFYRLEEIRGNYDRTDLLKITSGEPKPYT